MTQPRDVNGVQHERWLEGVRLQLIGAVFLWNIEGNDENASAAQNTQ